MKFKITKINDKTIHYEWLMEHVNKLVGYAKREDFKSVAHECENILEGLRENKLDSRSKKDSKVKDEEITFDTLLKSEYEAISLYTSMLAKIDDESIKMVLKHILDEENEHIVELKKVMTVIKKDNIVGDMGRIVKGRRIEAHNTYNNRITLDDLYSTLKLVQKTGSEDDVKILEGQLIEIAGDYLADISDPDLDKQDTLKHYEKYKNLVEKFKNSKISKDYSNAINKFLSKVNV